MMADRRAFTLLEMMTAIFIMAIVTNMIIVTYVRADRANTRAMVGLQRLLVVNRTMDHLRRTIRRSEGIVARHGQWRSDGETLVLRTGDGRTLVFTRQGEALAEIDPARAGGKPLLRNVHAEGIRFEYGGAAEGETADARLVTITMALAPAWPDSYDRLVVRTSAAVRTDGRTRP